MNRYGYLELEHLSLGQLISELEKRPEGRQVALGFCEPHSYRGYYERLAFVPDENTTVGAMLAYARQALGNTYCGHKGGAWKMDKDTLVYLAYHGHSGEQIGRTLLGLMIGSEAGDTWETKHDLTDRKTEALKRLISILEWPELSMTIKLYMLHNAVNDLLKVEN